MLGDRHNRKGRAMTESALFTIPEPTPRFLVGMEARGGARFHAISEKDLATAKDRNPDGVAILETWSVCSRYCVRHERWGTWNISNPTLVSGAWSRCPVCSWHVALTQTSTEALLGALDSRLAALCRAILKAEEYDKAEYGEGEPFDPEQQALLDLLVHATAHGPSETRDPDCWEHECDHDEGTCPSSYVCLVCSLVDGAESTDWRCIVEQPCSATAALITRYLTPASVSQ